jgi:hypothetical protein
MCATQYGAFWFDYAGGRCMRLVYGSDNVYWPVYNEVIDTMQDKYYINMYDYYSAACDCALNGPEDGEPDYHALLGDGSLPQCFYNIDCLDASACGKSSSNWWLKTRR